MIVRAFRHLFVLCCILPVLAPEGPSRPAGGPRFTVARPPDWVDEVDVPESAADAAADARDGILDLLVDTQVRVTGTGVWRYTRQVAKVLSSAGLEDASQLQFGFDPSSESLVLHSVRIVRDGRLTEALDASEVRVVQPERELDDQIYTGQLSALVFLRDVRPGDVVDYSYSVVAGTGYFGGRYADSIPLGAPFPVRTVRCRVLWPAGRVLAARSVNTDVSPRMKVLGEETEYLWELVDVAAVEADEGAPAWFDPTPRVEVSEFGAWADVVAAVLPFYAVAGPPPALAREIESWVAREPTVEGRLMAATRFVQDQMRYTGIELGPSSFRPADPATVLERRFGDCKDKSLLLVTALRAMGIEAYPALVHTERGPVLPDAQPSPYAFDHVIVRASIREKTFWIDPTITLQRGGVDVHHDPGYRFALVVRGGVDALEQLGAPASERVTTSIHERFVLSQWDGPATLEVVTTLEGPDADELRVTLARTPLSKLGEESLDYYSDRFPTVANEGLPVVSDDESANRIVIRERFRIPQFWEDGTCTLVADRIEAVLPETRGARRASPLELPYPRSIAQSIEVVFPGAISVAPASVEHADDALDFAYVRTTDDNTLRLDYRIRTVRDSVSADHASRARDSVRRLRRLSHFTIDRESIAATNGWAGLLTSAAAGLALGWLVWRARRRRDATELATLVAGPAPGESPASAIRLSTRAEAARHVSTLRCECGGLLDHESFPVREDALTFDGRKLTVAGAACGACGQIRDIYLDSTTSRGASAGA